MPATQPQQPVKEALQKLSPLTYEQQAQLAAWEEQAGKPQTFCDELQAAYCSGSLDAFIRKANEEFERGEALDRFC